MAIRFWHRRPKEPRTSFLARIYIFTSFGLQMVISGILLGIGLFFVIFYETYFLIAISKFGYYYFLSLTGWILPHLMAIGAMIGFLFAYFWFTMAPRPVENSGFLILSALVYIGFIGFCITPFIAFDLFVIGVPDVTPISASDLLFIGNLLNLQFIGIMTLIALPSLLVLIAGGGVKLLTHWSAPPLDDATALISPRGVRTSHSMLANALHREKDKTRSTNRQRED